MRAQSTCYRLVAIDLDGTLLTPEKQISDETLQVLQQVREQDVVVMLCTGRTLHKAREVTQRIPFEFLLALHNGAVIVEAHSGRVLANHPLPHWQTDAALNFLKENQFHPTVYTFNDGKYCLYHEPDSMNEGTKLFLQSKESVLYPCADVRTCLVDHPIHIVAVDHRERVLWAMEELKQLLGMANVITSGGFYGNRFWFLEILGNCASKSQAIHAIAQQHGISRQQVLAIGDNYNDLDMLAYAGLGIAMKNASETIRTQADVITESNDNDGVAKALRKYVLPSQF